MSGTCWQAFRSAGKRLHVEPFIGADKLASLTAPRVSELDDKLRAAGRSLAMRRKVLTNLKTMLTFCQGKGNVAARRWFRGVPCRIAKP